MEWLMNNWYLILALIAVLAIVISAIIGFFKMPTEQQIANVKEWLKWAVVQAEKELHEKTGALKLRMVYDMAIAKFPWIEKVVSFSEFSSWVDEALEWMERQLSCNPVVSKMVKGE